VAIAKPVILATREASGLFGVRPKKRRETSRMSIWRLQNGLHALRLAGRSKMEKRSSEERDT
jgi:hypothetical protein